MRVRVPQGWVTCVEVGHNLAIGASSPGSGIDETSPKSCISLYCTAG
ncbi:MAG: hypothetical protein ACI8W3_001210 [Myxococcota bacterium]|jgi:hypothetical protein